MPSMNQGRQARESGQAAVEAALTLPLLVFLILGTLQLFMMLQGRIMAEYAAFQAVRAGSRHHGDCTPMIHAAMGGLLPTVEPFARPGSGSTAQRLADAWAARLGPDLRRQPVANYEPGRDSGHDGPIFWLVRESPRTVSLNEKEDLDFDTPSGDGSNAKRLEVRLIYW